MICDWLQGDKQTKAINSNDTDVATAEREKQTEYE